MIKGDDVTAKAESFGLREDNRLTADFQDSDLATFCHKAGTDIQFSQTAALKVLILFATTYHCDAGFSTMVTIKTNARNRLDLAHNLRCALAVTKPRISQLVKKKQFQPSH